MASFDYNLLITGDCGNVGSGSIRIEFTGGTPPYTVNWVSPNLSYDITTSVSERSGLYPNTYVLEVNDSTLPLNQQFIINIPVSSGCCVSIDSVSDTTCGLNNGSITGSSTSLFSSSTYKLYSFDNTYIESANVNTEYFNFNNLSAGTYYVTVEDIGGCTGASETFIINNSSELNFGIYSVPDSTCYDNPTGKLYVTGVTGQAPYTYVWSNGLTGSTVTGLTNGVYSVTVTDSIGCSKTKTSVITSVPQLTFANVTATNPTCFLNDGRLTFTLTGGTAPFYYSASTGDVAISYSNTYTLNDLSSGVYTLRATDAGLCSTSVSSTLTSPSGVLGVGISTTNSYCSNDNGKITISINGGVSPFTYTLIDSSGNTNTITNSLTSYVFTGLSTGEYTAIFSDVSGCTYSEILTILTEDKFQIGVSTTGTTCGSNNGSAYIYISSGETNIYTYRLDGVVLISETISTGITVNDLVSGTHLVDVIDSSGCIQSQSFYVSPSNSVDFSLNSTSCGTGSQGTITAFISNGKPPFSFYWSDNVVGNPQSIIASGLTGGSYSLTVVDADNCSLSRDITVSCYNQYNSYQTYSVVSENFVIQTPTKRGMLQLLNEAFNDVASGNTGCVLVQSEFIAEVVVVPSGYSDSISFFTGYTKTSVPSDNEWYDSVKILLETIDGIDEVIVNPLNNVITIKTDPLNTTLNEQLIEVNLKINFDINCSS